MVPGIEYEDPDDVVHTRFGVIVSHISVRPGLRSCSSAWFRQRSVSVFIRPWRRNAIAR
jgi:hypothetical protein